MNNKKYNTVVHAVRNVLLLGLSSSLMMPVAFSATEDEESGNEKIVVTGSRLKRSEAEGPSPVVTITRQDMENQGYATLQDAMDALVQNTGGSTDQSFTFGFTPGASSVDLRGFGNGRSLTLIDGKRLPVYPVANSGTDNFVDLSAIPASMIERVEILTDGASAIYGSDAVSGVINIITRKDFEGLELGVRFGDTSDGGYENKRVSVVAGSTNGQTSVSVMAEFTANDELKATDRDYAATDIADPRGAYSSGGANFQAISADADGNLSSETIAYPLCGDPNDELGSRLVNTGVAGDFCRYDRSQHRQLFPENDKKAIMARVDHELTDDIKVYARAGFSNYKTRTNLEPNYYNAWWGGQQPGNNFSVVSPPAVSNILAGVSQGTLPNGSLDYVWGMVPAGAANNPTTGTANERDGFFRRRLFEFGDRSSLIQNDGVNVLMGAEGTFGSGQYDWTTSVGYNQSRLTIQRKNIISSAFNNLVTNGLDLFQIIPDSVVNSVSYMSVRNSESNNVIADFQVSGELPWELSGGAVGFAAFVDYERQWFFNTADPITLSGDAFDGSSAGSGERDHIGVGFELGLPLTEAWEMSVALRNDSYNDDSDVGSALSPRVALTWRPNSEVLVRFSAGESFRAPDLQRLFGATTNGFISVTDPNFTPDPNNPAEPIPRTDDSQPVWVEQSVPTQTGSNVALEEEEGENFNIGVVWSVTDDFSLTVDAYNMRLENIVSTPTAQFMVNQCDSTGVRFCNNITRNPAGRLSGIAAVARNLSSQEITGADITARYKLPAENLGDFAFKFELAYVDSFKTQFDSSAPIVENTGFASIPDLRANVTVDWTRDEWGATLKHQWVGDMCGVNGGGAPDGSCLSSEFIDPYQLTNVSIRRDMGSAGLISLGINNLFNEDPAVDPTNNQWPWFFNNGGFSNPIGREVSVSYTVTF
ncbi:TonB-dependent siderophore receptor [Pleionea sp. CnH1-48]|uniref:TonB-dependent receptor plug domain-containing protein n=1 Tax=Pleionea sp. CnH1-48 TaxID=2954494 RepID=UPI00209789FA|nr:TonB-dependent receptor [Pleionea sp. CnH1-48]MCO7225037.1 TonB-dependent receptor [Pleionea sp. CnH1-48]